jgi:hypothetical protein
MEMNATQSKGALLNLATSVVQSNVHITAF